MKQTHPTRLAAMLPICLFGLFAGLPSPSWALVQLTRSGFDDGLTQAATWKPASPEEVQTAFNNWLGQSDANEETVELVREFLKNDFRHDARGQTLDWVIDGIAIVRPDVKRVRERLRALRLGNRVPDFSSLLENPAETQFLRDHVRLYFGRWLAQNEFYDEALSQFDKIELERVLDPATLLFYRGLMEHQLLKKDKCLITVEKLLENSNQLPRRYEVLSRLMLADIQPMKPDSLDEISRLMSDIRRRTGLYRSGKLVLEEEQTVIKKLDKLIEQLESQQQSQQAADNTVPSSPMQDSFNAGGKGDGQATSKRQSEGGNWGNLPPAERAAALAEMAKDMPPHYRAVIEEYFRKLARENKR